MFAKKVKNDRYMRLRYLLIASILAMLAAGPSLLLPLDILTWALQSKLGQQEASGEIVFVPVPSDILETPESRSTLASTLENIGGLGPDHVYLDLVQSQSTFFRSDSHLAETVEQTDNTLLVARYVTVNDQKKLVFPPNPLFGDGNLVIEDRWLDAFGYAWQVPSSFAHDGKMVESFSAALSGRDGNLSNPIYIDYRFNTSSIPTLDFAELASGKISTFDVEGKDIVLGYSGVGDSTRIPTSQSLPPSYISIFAAETAKKGGFHFFSALAPVFIILIILLVAVVSRHVTRRALYLVTAAFTVATIIAPIFVSIRVEAGPALFQVGLFAFLTLRNRWQNTFKFKSMKTGLPSLALLEETISALSPETPKAVMSARIHNLTDVLASLPADSHETYFLAIVKRLRASNPELQIYADNGEYLLWTQDYDRRDTLEAHCIALRALFTSPVIVNDMEVDIAITFAVDLALSEKASKRVATATSIASRTSLAEKPIIIQESPNYYDADWRISLQAKIDKALHNGEIFPVYQPQVDLSTGRIVGYEALVRWQDRDRGFISPAYFIEQCEQAGRMDKLTRFVMTSAAKEFVSEGFHLQNKTISVNVSATLLTDTRLADIVSDVLDATGLPPGCLMIELTETARIHNIGTAKAVLSSLKAIGVKLSLDDYGTGTANLETLFNFPFDELKVDLTFVRKLPKSQKAAVIVREAIALGKALKLKVICEGIEDQATLELLKAMSCPLGQGYYLGRPAAPPLPADRLKLAS